MLQVLSAYIRTRRRPGKSASELLLDCLDESYESTQHAFIRPGRDGDFGLRIDRLAKGRVRVCDCFF